MKKSSIFSFASMAMMLMLVSCNKEIKDANSESEPVRFEILSNETKAAVVTTESINKAGNSFVVDLFNTETKAVVGEGLVAACDGTQWELTPMTYWEWRTLDAWARYPQTLDGSSIGMVNSYNDGKISIDADRTYQSFNFLTYYDEAASPRKDADKQDDLLFACTKGSKYTENNGRIKLTFAHALSAVYFKVAVEDGSNLELGENVIINSLELAGVKRAGSCVYNPSLEDAARFAWDTEVVAGGLDRNVGSYVQTYGQAAIGGAFLGGTSFETANCFFVIPQAMTDAATLTVNWSKDGVARDPRTAQIFKDKNGNVVEWKAGYKYLYTLKIKNRGADVEVDIKVLPWDGNEMNIDFDSTVAASQEGKLAFSNATIEGQKVVFKSLDSEIKGQFQLAQPENGQWLVSLTNTQDFELVLKDAEGNVVSSGALVSGSIDENVAEFYIKPKAGINTAVNHETKVLISAMRADGETVSADDALENNFTIILNKIG